MAHPFRPMTTELLKKLTRVSQDSDTAIRLLEISFEFASQQLKFISELNPQHSETDQSRLSTSNRY